MRLLPSMLILLLALPLARAEQQIVPAEGQASEGDTLMWVSRDAKEDAMLEVGFEQKLNQQVPLDLSFRDETGKTVQLKDYFSDKPVVLSLVYFQCPMTCNMLLNGVTNVLGKLKFTVGREFEMVTLSFDHEETHVLAAGKKMNYLQEYNRAGADEGWHFLVGEKEPISTLTEACGFSYKYNPRTDEWSHRAGLLVLTPEGRISRYLAGVDFSKRDLRLALVEAADGKIGSISDKIFLSCYKYDPKTGKYTRAVTTTLKTACLATVGALGMLLFVMFRKDVERQRSFAGDPDAPTTDPTQDSE